MLKIIIQNRWHIKQKLRDYIDRISILDFEHAVPGHGNIFTREELLDYLEKEYAKMR